MTDNELAKKLEAYQFYHTIPLRSGISTPGHQEKWVVDVWNMVLKAMRAVEMRDRRVLDIGCRDGLFSFEAEKRGAREVIAIDNDLSNAAVEFLIPFFQSKVRMVEINLYDLTPERFGRFDVICFPGVLYHLRYPFWGLKIIRELLNDDGVLILETALFIDDNRRAMLNCPIGWDCPGLDPTNCAHFNLKGLVDTLFSLGITVERIEYLWERGLVRKPTTRVEVTPADFDEAHYAIENPDIGEAIRARVWKMTGYHHWISTGRAEGRIARLKDGTRLDPGTPVMLEDEHYNRAVFVARKSSAAVNPHVHSYLEGKHTVHSENARDLPYGPWDEFPQAPPVLEIAQYSP